ncbi:hypothetical protein JNUCC0626_40055 [Lentzea sp. JNUCC 0626]|uniref:hypothetical protein n=1 Tax=Lentzea sp. JNUCC 0626 TaxID=3367513 RepID=UPI003749DCA2
MSIEHIGRHITVTIKYGKDYEGSQAIFSGQVGEVREDICAFFGVECESLSNLSLNDIVVDMTSLAHGVSNLASILGAVAVGSPPATETVTEPAPGEDVWAGADTSTPPWPTDKPAENPLLAQIKTAPSIPDLQRIWAENQAAFANGDLMDAYKQRGRALKAAA